MNLRVSLFCRAALSHAQFAPENVLVGAAGVTHADPECRVVVPEAPAEKHAGSPGAPLALQPGARSGSTGCVRSLVSGALPSGLTLGMDGQISGSRIEGRRGAMRLVITAAAVLACPPSWARESSAPPASTPAAGFENRFRQLDRNGDGKLDRAEADAAPWLRTEFEFIDAGRDGGISRQELGTAMRQWWRSRMESEPESGEPPAPATPPKPAMPRTSKKPVTDPATPPDEHGPRFRGPRGDGVACGANLPVTWSSTNNVAWTCFIPGKGWSSPVVWGERVFVTSAAGPGAVEAPRDLGASVIEHIRGETTTDEHQYLLHCVDWQTGKLLWSRRVCKAVPPGRIHPKNSYASETPVTDGERVYAYFGGIGLFCCDLEGRELWSRTWGSFTMDWNWGTSASPVLHGDRLFLVNDNAEHSFLVALDTRTGKDIWRVERDEKSNWSNPFVWQNDRRTELVTSGSGKVRSYDLDGSLLWELSGMSGVTVPTPFAAGGWLYIASGCERSSFKPVYAIRSGASGDISLRGEATSSTFVAWCQRRAAPYVTSPLVYEGILYVLLDRGYLAAYDARTGEEIYGKQRFPSAKAGFSASPWACDGKIFCLRETGETYVVEAGPEFRLLHVNSLDEAAFATPAIARDSLVIRTLTKLYRIANTPKP